MSCEQARGALSRRADGLASAEEERALSVHLAGCADCRQFETVLARVSDHFRTLPRPESPRDMADRVAKELRGKRGRIIALGPFLKRATAVAAAILLVSTTAIFVWPAPARGRPVEMSREGALKLIMSRIAREQIVNTKESNR